MTRNPESEGDYPLWPKVLFVMFMGVLAAATIIIPVASALDGMFVGRESSGGMFGVCIAVGIAAVFVFVRLLSALITGR